MDELYNIPLEQKTPLKIANPLRFDHFLQFEEGVAITDLEQEGYAHEMTYEEAYHNLGLSERHMPNLEILGATKKPVWQITPKGNGLIFLSQNKKQKEWIHLLQPQEGSI